jgi:hypothetical protein
MATRISRYDLKMAVGEEEVIPYKTISLQTLESVEWFLVVL